MLGKSTTHRQGNRAGIAFPSIVESYESCTSFRYFFVIYEDWNWFIDLFYEYHIFIYENTIHSWNYFKIYRFEIFCCIMEIFSPSWKIYKIHLLIQWFNPIFAKIWNWKSYSDEISKLCVHTSTYQLKLQRIVIKDKTNNCKNSNKQTK